MKCLIVAEKPSVAGEIAGVLGARRAGSWYESDDCIVSNAIGHLIELDVPEANTAGFGLGALPIIPAAFGTRVIEKTASQFATLCSLMLRPDVASIVNACDAGREGEAIFRLIYEHAGCRLPMARMWLQSMTPQAIAAAYAARKPGREYQSYADAARCRAEADWLFGINGTRAVSSLQRNLSGQNIQFPVGRVQTPTLYLVHQRAEAVRAFVSRPFWRVVATFGHDGTEAVWQGRWSGGAEAAPDAGGEDDAGAKGSRLFDKAQALAVFERCSEYAAQGGRIDVTEEAAQTNTRPPLLFDLTTLQKEANKLFKFSAAKTLDLAQELYEKHKATSYPRTDSRALPEDYGDTARSILAALVRSLPELAEIAAAASPAALDAAGTKRVFDNAKISDHFAIVPTLTVPRLADLSEDAARIYLLVARRFVAVFYPPAIHAETYRTAMLGPDTFQTKGRVLVQPGWLLVYGGPAATAAGDGGQLCSLASATEHELVDVSLSEGKTTAPRLYTEATLLAAMESAGKLVDDAQLADAMRERGLGTPATRASTIEGLLSDTLASGAATTPYMLREGKEQYLVPTGKTDQLMAFLQKHQVVQFTTPTMTGEWEYKLKEVERGSLSRTAFMHGVASEVQGFVGTIQAQDRINSSQYSARCPKCQGALAPDGIVLNCEGQERGQGCGFKFFRTIAQRALSEAEVRTLFTTGELGPLTGFVSKEGKPFEVAGLALQADFSVEMKFAPRPATASRAKAWLKRY